MARRGPNRSSRIARRAPNRSAVITRSDALRDGWGSDEIQRLRRRSAWFSLRPGAYLDAAMAAVSDERRLHVARIAATLPRAAGDAVVSHLSAAVLHGVALWRPVPERVQVTRVGPGGGQLRRRLHTHRATLDDDEIVELAGHRVTSIDRTLVDLARYLSFAEAVVAIDHALHAHLTMKPMLIRSLERAGPRPGIKKARRAVAFADPASESVGESRSRVIFSRAGLPDPTCQLVIRGSSETVVGRVDFAWQAYRTIGEFDGAAKYGRLLGPGQAPGDAVFREKLREDALRDLGWTVVRWTWADLDRPDELVGRVARALHRGRDGR